MNLMAKFEYIFLVGKWKNQFDAYRKTRDRERDPAKSGAPGSKLPTCKFYNELNFLKDIATTRVTTTNLVLPMPLGSPSFTLQHPSAPFNEV